MNAGKDNQTAAGAATGQDPRWAAVVARDRAADGRFVYSVRTTGVYCRPSCGARLPRRENVRFHSTCAEAEEAGFRPCKRCRPKEPGPADRRAPVVGRDRGRDRRRSSMPLGGRCARALAVAMMIVSPATVAADPGTAGGSGAPAEPVRERASAPSPSAPAGGMLTGKERLGDKASDDQRLDNCKVPPEKRGPKPRPDSCDHDDSGVH